MPLIELGEISPGSDPGPGPGRGYDRRLVRRIGVVLTALLCVLTAAGSARPDPHDLRTLWTIPSGGDDFAFAGETAFVLAPEAPLALGADPTAGSRWGRRPWSGNGRTLTAYDVRDGSVLWARQVDDQASYVSLADRADRLLLPARFVDVQAETPDGTQFYGDVSQDVVALDTRTGATVSLVISPAQTSSQIASRSAPSSG